MSRDGVGEDVASLWPNLRSSMIDSVSQFFGRPQGPLVENEALIPSEKEQKTLENVLEGISSRSGRVVEATDLTSSFSSAGSSNLFSSSNDLFDVSLGFALIGQNFIYIYDYFTTWAVSRVCHERT